MKTLCKHRFAPFVSPGVTTTRTTRDTDTGARCLSRCVTWEMDNGIDAASRALVPVRPLRAIVIGAYHAALATHSQTAR